jgi:hypothetical protein
MADCFATLALPKPYSPTFIINIADPLPLAREENTKPFHYSFLAIEAFAHIIACSKFVKARDFSLLSGHRLEIK